MVTALFAREGYSHVSKYDHVIGTWKEVDGPVIGTWKEVGGPVIGT